MKKLGSTAGYNSDTNVGGCWYDPTSFAEVYDPNNPGSCAPPLGNSGFNNLRARGVFNCDIGVFRDLSGPRIIFRGESAGRTPGNTEEVTAEDVTQAKALPHGTPKAVTTIRRRDKRSRSDACGR
jgi:hypothetical protein